MPSSDRHHPETWLPLTQEDVIEPDLRIVDPHHHLWDYRDRDGYQPTYLLDELHADTGSGHRIEATVFVECSWAYRTDGPVELREVGETEFVASQAALSRERIEQATIGAIVAACDLRLGSKLNGVLDAHDQAAAGLFRGIRHRLAHDPTGSARTSAPHENIEGLMGTDEFRAGVALLGTRGLTFDAWIYHVQLRELISLAQAVPGTTIILDHIAGPIAVGSYADRWDEVRTEWLADLAELSRCSNVVVKVGGIGMPTYGSGYERRDVPPNSDQIVADWGDDLRFIIDTFGADRCMFESNFPVDKVSFSYRIMWNAYKKLSAHYSEDDREKLFSGTARRIYRVAQ